jgi:hypothetical protein
MRSTPLMLAALCALAACATPPAPKAPAAPLTTTNPNASIPFVSLGGIRSWKAQDDGSLVLEGATGRLYRATFLNDCREIKFAGPDIAIVTGPGGEADRFASVLVNGRTCNFATLDEVIDPASRAAAAPSGRVQGGALAPPPAR